MKNIKRIMLSSILSMVLPVMVSSVYAAEPEEEDETLACVGSGCDASTTPRGYVQGIKEIPLGDYEQLLLLNITYEDSEEGGSFEKSEEISKKIKSFTGFEGSIGYGSEFDVNTLVSQNELTPSESILNILSYNELMKAADEAKEKGDVGTIYNAYRMYNSGFYKESVLEHAKNEFYGLKGIDYASGVYVEVISGENVDNKSSAVTTLGGLLKNLMGSKFQLAYDKYNKYVIKDKEKGYGYSVPVDELYGNLDVFSLFASEYAFFKYEMASATTIEDMKAALDKLIRQGSSTDRMDTVARYNMFQSQALATLFANSITIREITQGYINSKTDVSALGTKAENGRSNWYAINMLTSGMIQVLGWEAVLDAGLIEYEASSRIKGLDKDEITDSTTDSTSSGS